MYTRKSYYALLVPAIAAGCLVGLSFTGIFNGTVERLFPPAQSKVTGFLSEASISLLVDKGKAINKLIDVVEKEEAKLKTFAAPSKYNSERILQKRQEISKLYLEIANIYEMESLQVTSVPGEYKVFAEAKTAADSFRQLASNALQLNSALSRYQP